MSLNKARIDISTLLATKWTDCKVVPRLSDDGDKHLEGLTPWIYSFIKWGNQTQEARSGKSVYESTSGVLNIRLYVRVADGTGLMDQLTDKLFNFFRFSNLPGIIIQSKAIANDGVDSDWQIRYLTISFKLRSFHSPE